MILELVNAVKRWATWSQLNQQSLTGNKTLQYQGRIKGNSKAVCSGRHFRRMFSKATSFLP